jgi:Acyl-CoA reductase (LuxC)
MIESLGAVSKLWLDPAYPLREQTLEALRVSSGFSRRQIEMALANCFAELAPERISAFTKSFSMQAPKRHPSPSSYPLKEDKPFPVLHILPANAFTAWVHGAVITLLLGHRCLLKPSLREPIFARAWKQSLDEVDPALGEQVEVVAWAEGCLQESEAVVAYGSDETLAKIRSQLPPGARFAGYGHKLSVGVIFRESLEDGLSDRLLHCVLRDAEPFRLQGCLSPQILFIEDPHFSRWPMLEAALDVAPKIRTFTQWAEVLQNLMTFRPYLSCVGYAGSSERAEFLGRELRDADVSRICPLGEMQRPPLSWRNGGLFLPDLLH